MVERISFDRVADVYDETRGLPPRVLAKAAGFLAEELQGKRVLEIGVGTGRIAVPLQKSGIQLVGIDIAPQMVAHGREKGLRNVVFADGARLPFRDRTFDAATSNHVLHLVADWRNVLREVERILRPDGLYFTIFEHSVSSVSPHERYRTIVQSLGWARTHPGLHERDFPKFVPPARLAHVTHHDAQVPADRILESLQQRLFAFMWKIPDDIHARTMDLLRQELGGTTLDRSFDLEVAYWTRPLVGKLASAP